MSDCDEDDRAFRRHSKPRTVQKIDKVCLDYQNSTCYYGASCRFLHPGGDEKKQSLTFCEDFRRGSCYNSRCVRLHANQIIEEEYRATGWLPIDLQQWVIEKYGLCHKYLTETCLRGDECKFQHTSLGLDLKNVRVRKRGGTHRPQSGKDYREEGVHDIVRSCGVCKEFTQGNCSRGETCKFQHSSPMECGVGNNKTTWKDVWKREEGTEWENGPDRKRRMVDDGRDFFSGMVPMGGTPNNSGGIGNNGMMRNMDGMQQAMGNGMSGMGGGMMPNMGMAKPFESNDQVWKLQNQVLDLKNENEELKKKIEGMRATNQFLLEENANIRMERMKEAEGRSRDNDGLGRYSGRDASRDRYGEKGRDNYGTSRFNDTGTTRY